MRDSGKRIVVIGYGRMGSWLAEFLSEKNIIAIYDPFLKELPQLNIKVLNDPAEIRSFAPDVTINAVTPGLTVKVFEQLIDNIPAGSVIADIASVKSDLPDFYGRCKNPFASFHPMFGPTLATMSDLSGKRMIIIEESEAGIKSWWKDIFSDTGVKITEMSFLNHDKEMIHSLALPVLMSTFFAGEINDEDTPGTSYSKHLELARAIFSEDPELLTLILRTNGSDALIERVMGSAGRLLEAIRSEDKSQLNEMVLEISRKHPLQVNKKNISS